MVFMAADKQHRTFRKYMLPIFKTFPISDKHKLTNIMKSFLKKDFIYFTQEDAKQSVLLDK